MLLSQIEKWLTVPQLAVAVGNVIAELFEVVPPVPADGLVVVPAPPVDAQFEVDGFSVTRK